MHLFLYAGVYCTIIPKKQMDQLKHQDIIIEWMGINQTDSNLHIPVCCPVWTNILHTKSKKCLASLFVR